MNKFANVAKKVAEANPMPQMVIPSPVAGSTLSIDADYACYFCAGGPDTSPGQARQIARSKFSSLQTMTGATSIRLHLTAQGSHKGHRYLIATVKPYQGKRTGHKPKNWAALRQWLETYNGQAYKVSQMLTREADDSIAYLSSVIPHHLHFIATADKDMRQLPGMHINWATYHITEVKPDDFRVVGVDGLVYGPAWFWQQMLQGDGADDIPGLEGHPDGPRGQVGDKTAAEWIGRVNSNEEASEFVAQCYLEYYGAKDWAERFAEQAMLLWLRRDKGADMLDFTKHLPLPPAVVKGAKAIKARVEAQLKEAAELTKLAQQNAPAADEKAPPLASRKRVATTPQAKESKPSQPFSWPHPWPPNTEKR